MTQIFHVHSENPQKRLIQQAVNILRDGGVIVYPTDAAYAFGCTVGNKSALERIVQIRQLGSKHNFTIACHNLSELATYARVDNQVFRLLKNNTPGPYTFILAATAEVPRRLMHPKRKTVGLRIPDNKIALALLEALGEPLMTTTLIMPNESEPLVDPEEILELLSRRIELVIDGGWGETSTTTVVDLVDSIPVLVREGKGSLEKVGLEPFR
ncbi:Putative translation factor (SUA5) [gamma proteobacterium HdN1]|nr:Putative translation factor (SUA5) [gamma proteobacterium HdN1]